MDAEHLIPRLFIQEQQDSGNDMLEEVRLVATGQRMMIVRHFLPLQVKESERRYAEFSKAVEKNHLLMIHYSEPSSDVMVLVVKPEQAWRVQAYCALYKIVSELGSWSFHFEMLSSYLLGFDAQKRKHWMDKQRWTRIGYGMETLYFLHKGGTSEELSGRGEISTDECIAVWCRGFNRSLRTDAFQVLDGWLLARAGISTQVLGAWLDASRSVSGARLLYTVMTCSSRNFINRSLETRIQCLTRNGWTGADKDSLQTQARTLHDEWHGLSEIKE